MTVLLIAEHDNTRLKPATFNAFTAAQKLGDVDILVAGQGCAAVGAEASRIADAKKVLVADDASYKDFPAENVAVLVAKLGADYTHILAPSTATGKNMLPRAAALLDMQMLSDVTGIESANTFIRPVYVGSAFVTVRSEDKIKVMTVRPTAFSPAPATGGSAAVESIAGAGDTGLSAFVSRQLIRSARPEITSARVVVSGGRGMGSGENFKMLDALADKLNAAVGASRAAVDAGYAPNDCQVGQTGKIVAPELYIAVAISGAIQHTAGMKDSKVIVAINKDPDAPIFQIADYGLVQDMLQALPELTKAL
ncbi:MAG: FAD-binding protein [Pseudomonadota bacterium]